jgi:hypothetical protein
MKRGDLVRLVKRVAMPQFTDEDVGKCAIVTHQPSEFSSKRNDWVVILLEGQFRLEAIQNLEVLDEER